MSSSFSLSMQLRAAQQVVKAEMPRRAVAARILLICDIVSTMLLIQIGQFTHPAFSIIPIVILVFGASLRWNMLDPLTNDRLNDPRALLGVLVAPVRYSAFGLCKKQKGAPRTVAATVLVRLVCGVLLLVIIANRKCGNPAMPWHCHCSWNWRKKKYVGIYCPTVWYSSQSRSLSSSITIRQEEHATVSWADHSREPLCPGFADSRDGRAIGHWLDPNIDFNCSSPGLVPAMLQASCENGELDLMGFYLCSESSWFPGICTAQFTMCGALSGGIDLKKLLVLTYFFLPLLALMLLILTHLIGFRFEPPLVSVVENKELRKQIRHQAADLQRQLSRGGLKESLSCGRIDLAGKFLFFLLDIISDLNCLMSFLRSGLWGFAGAQFATLLVCGGFQLRVVCSGKFKKAIVDSWEAGVPTNVLQKIFLEEKTFEAPLSLFLQYYSAFWLTKDDVAFASLWMSICLSTVGISSGFYAAMHLSVFDLEDVRDEIQISMVSSDLSPTSFGTSSSQPPAVVPHFPPPGLDPPGPPGLGPPPGLDIQPKSRKPGQFASATE